MKPALAFVIAHFDAQGRLSTDLFELVAALAGVTRRIVFVSTGLSEAAAQRLRPHAQVIVRENVGYDFWSYRVGIEALGDLVGLDRLVIFNSSFVTLSRRALTEPFLAPVREPCLHGISRCSFGRPHLQSFWVAFEHQQLLRSSLFERWWTGMTPVSDRLEVIRRYELGMSAAFSDAGVPLRAAYRPTREDQILAISRMIASRPAELPFYVLPAEGREADQRAELNLIEASRLNPTHFLWDRVLHHAGIIKRDLLRNNPFDLSLRALWRACEKTPRYKALIDEAMAD